MSLNAESSLLLPIKYESWVFFVHFLSHLNDVNVTFVCGRQRKGDRVQHNRLAIVSCVQLLCAQA